MITFFIKGLDTVNDRVAPMFGFITKLYLICCNYHTFSFEKQAYKEKFKRPNRRAAREAFFGRRPKKAELSSPECGLDTVGVSTALGWTQAARCGLACVLYARQYVRCGKISDPGPNYRIFG